MSARRCAARDRYGRCQRDKGHVGWHEVKRERSTWRWMAPEDEAAQAWWNR